MIGQIVIFEDGILQTNTLSNNMKVTITIVLVTIIFSLGCNSKLQDEAELIVQGKHIAKTTFGVLSTELKEAMAKNGVTGAVQYCNINAMSITDSLSKVHNVTIRRVSDKWRNPLNQPSDEEQLVLDFYKQRMAETNKIEPIIKTKNNNKTFYAPIMMKGMCLTCHSDKSSIPDYSTISSLYPEDRAVGYRIGDLRGVWSVSFR